MASTLKSTSTNIMLYMSLSFYSISFVCYIHIQFELELNQSIKLWNATFIHSKWIFGYRSNLTTWGLKRKKA